MKYNSYVLAVGEEQASPCFLQSSDTKFKDLGQNLMNLNFEFVDSNIYLFKSLQCIIVNTCRTWTNPETLIQGKWLRRL